MLKRLMFILFVLSTVEVWARASTHALTVGEGFHHPSAYHDATPTFSSKRPNGTESQTAYQTEVQELEMKGTVPPHTAATIEFSNNRASETVTPETYHYKLEH